MQTSIVVNGLRAFKRMKPYSRPSPLRDYLRDNPHASTVEAAERFGVTRSRVSALRQELGLPPLRTGDGLTGLCTACSHQEWQHRRRAGQESCDYGRMPNTRARYTCDCQAFLPSQRLAKQRARRGAAGA